MADLTRVSTTGQRRSLSRERRSLRAGPVLRWAVRQSFRLTRLERAGKDYLARVANLVAAV